MASLPNGGLRLSRSSDQLSSPSPIEDKNIESSLVRAKSNSDTNICHKEPSTLTVNLDEVQIGLEQTVTVSFDIREEVTSTDWIGLFLIGVFFIYFPLYHSSTSLLFFILRRTRSIQTNRS